MIFIFEGHDLCGKTIAAEAVGAEFNIPVVTPWAELSAAKPSLTSISRTLMSVASAIGTHLIFDRFITSEYVYGDLLGRDTSYLDGLLEEWVDVADLRVVQVGLPEHELVARFHQRGDHLFSLTELLAIRRKYELLPTMLPTWVTHRQCSDIGEIRRHVSRLLHSA